MIFVTIITYKQISVYNYLFEIMKSFGFTKFIVSQLNNIICTYVYNFIYIYTTKKCCVWLLEKSL